MTHELQTHSEVSSEQFELTAARYIASTQHRLPCRSLPLGIATIQGHQQCLGKCSLLGNMKKKIAVYHKNIQNSGCMASVSRISAQDGRCLLGHWLCCDLLPRGSNLSDPNMRRRLTVNPCQQSPKVGWDGCGFSKAQGCLYKEREAHLVLGLNHCNRTEDEAKGVLWYHPPQCPS